jgi:uncharacterized sporulation protein YeaH/YhbH (DUF444 family)
MSHIVDKRFTIKDGSVVNRQKFIERYKNKIKEAVKNIINKESIKDFKFKDKKIKITTDDGSLDIPNFELDPENGVYSDISVGNKKYKKGQTVGKPPRGNGAGNKGSNKGGGEDGFEFVLTEQEFSDIFFEDLALPDLVKKQFTGDTYEIQRCGYSNSGGPSSLSIKQTIIRAFMRRFAIKKKIEKEGDKLIVEEGQIVVKKKKKISFLEDIDLKYNHKDRVELPSSKAVMFCLMDVSGSMGEKEKDISKRFFILLNMFLKRNYDIVDVVFVRHAEWAEECTEDVFFHGRESGGTVISSGYEKILDIVQQKYNPEQWNIYISQATDGDNFDSDNETMVNILTQHLLPICQYFAFVELRSGRFQPSVLFGICENIAKQAKNFAICFIDDYPQIFEVFRSLFTKEKGK